VATLYHLSAPVSHRSAASATTHNAVPVVQTSSVYAPPPRTYAPCISVPQPPIKFEWNFKLPFKFKFFFFKYVLRECGWKHASSKRGTKRPCPPNERSVTFAGRHLGDPSEDALSHWYNQILLIVSTTTPLTWHKWTNYGETMQYGRGPLGIPIIIVASRNWTCQGSRSVKDDVERD
jgi:hypothetical protein